MQHWRNTRRKIEQSDHHQGVELSLADLFDCKKYVDALELPRRRNVKTHLIGGFVSTFKGRGMDFDESRPYQQGDDIRSIDWRVTARTNEAHTKIYREERERPVFALVDQSASMMFGSQTQFKGVQAAKAVASVLWKTLSDGNRFGGILFNEYSHQEFRPASTRRATLQFMNALVEQHNQQISRCYGKGDKPQTTIQRPLKETLERARHLVKPGSLVFIVSDFKTFDNDCEHHLIRLSQHNDVCLLHIVDALDKQLPPAGEYAITDGRSIGTLETQSARLQQEYKKHFNDKKNYIGTLALKHRLRYFDIDTRMTMVDIFGMSSSEVPA